MTNRRAGNPTLRPWGPGGEHRPEHLVTDGNPHPVSFDPRRPRGTPGGRATRRGLGDASIDCGTCWRSVNNVSDKQGQANFCIMLGCSDPRAANSTSHVGPSSMPGPGTVQAFTAPAASSAPPDVWSSVSRVLGTSPQTVKQIALGALVLLVLSIVLGGKKGRR